MLDWPISSLRSAGGLTGDGVAGDGLTHMSGTWPGFSWGSGDVLATCLFHNGLVLACGQSSGHKVSKNSQRESESQCTSILNLCLRHTVIGQSKSHGYPQG